MLYIVSKPERDLLEADPALACAIARPNIHRILDAIPGARGVSVEFYPYRRCADFEGVETWVYGIDADCPEVETRIAKALRALFDVMTMLAGTHRLARESEPWEFGAGRGRRKRRTA